jgi:cytochrome c oxidase assembly protein subunit 11
MSTSPVKKTLVKLLVGAVGMFLFAIFVMPPLYYVLCDLTGIGGKTGGRYEAQDASVDITRSVKVQFITTNNGSMPWDFSPKITEIVVHPGEPTAVAFYARNRTSKDMVAQAIPNVSPFSATRYFHKTECFCFNEQPLDAWSETDMPLVFIVDKDIPKSVNTITLSYTLFDITNREDPPVAQLN